MYVCFCLAPFYKFHNNEVASISRVEENQAVGCGGFELKKEVHGGIGLQRCQSQVAAFCPERHRVGNDVAHAKAGIKFTVGDVSIFAVI